MELKRATARRADPARTGAIRGAYTLAVDPLLPAWLPEIELRGLKIGSTTATLRFRRYERGHSHAEVLEKDGPLNLLRQPPPESHRPAGAGGCARFWVRVWRHRPEAGRAVSAPD